MSDEPTKTMMKLGRYGFTYYLSADRDPKKRVYFGHSITTAARRFAQHKSKPTAASSVIMAFPKAKLTIVEEWFDLPDDKDEARLFLLVQEQALIDLFKGEEECVNKQRAYGHDHKASARSYRQSSKGKAVTQAYAQSAKGKAIGKASRIAYVQSAKGNATRLAYAQTAKANATKPERKAAKRAYEQSYNQTPERKAARKAQDQSAKYKAKRKAARLARLSGVSDDD